MDCDILIVGGGAGGTAAALAAAESGASVILLEETDWLGGQLTTQGVCTPDEQQHIETFGGTRRYMMFRDAVRRFYRSEYILSPAAKEAEYFNPGNCWVSRISFEPRVGARLLREMTAPFEDSGNLRIFFKTTAISCEMDSSDPHRIAEVIARQEDGSELRFTPRYVLDATDLGGLLPMCGEEGIDWTTGAESAAETGEPDAPETPRAHWVQPFTFPFAIDWSPETSSTNVIDPPEDYEELKASQKYHVKHGAITGLFAGAMPWWRYRRVLARENFDDPRIVSDLAMINTAGNDYYGGNLIGKSRTMSERFGFEREQTLAAARRASLGYLYWLQTECEREEADLDAAPNAQRLTPKHPTPNAQHLTRGYPEFRLRKDVFDTSDGCSPKPYIRESRRICSLRPILEQEIVVKDFHGNVCRGDLARSAFMPDSVGVGHYALDIHPNGHGEPNHYVATRPFQIPLGALIPMRLTNLLPACKNLGVTHLTNGAYRLHPIEWNIGESAGTLAAWCLHNATTPRQVYEDSRLRAAFQDRLIADGIALHWYIDVPISHSVFAAVQWLAGKCAVLGSEQDLLFRPDEPLNLEDWEVWKRACGLDSGELQVGCTRAEAAVRLHYA